MSTGGKDDVGRAVDNIQGNGSSDWFSLSVSFSVLISFQTFEQIQSLSLADRNGLGWFDAIISPVIQCVKCNKYWLHKRQRYLQLLLLCFCPKQCSLLSSDIGHWSRTSSLYLLSSRTPKDFFFAICKNLLYLHSFVILPAWFAKKKKVEESHQPSKFQKKVSKLIKFKRFEMSTFLWWDHDFP